MWPMSITKRQMRYRLLYFGVLGLLIVSSVLLLVFADWWWAVVPIVVAIGWVSPLTSVIVDRCISDQED